MTCKAAWGGLSFLPPPPCSPVATAACPPPWAGPQAGPPHPRVPRPSDTPLQHLLLSCPRPRRPAPLPRPLSAAPVASQDSWSSQGRIHLRGQLPRPSSLSASGVTLAAHDYCNTLLWFRDLTPPAPTPQAKGTDSIALTSLGRSQSPRCEPLARGRGPASCPAGRRQSLGGPRTRALAAPKLAKTPDQALRCPQPQAVRSQAPELCGPEAQFPRLENNAPA